MLVGSIVVQNRQVFITQLIDIPYTSTPAAEKPV